jgi:hypothetical protein
VYGEWSSPHDTLFQYAERAVLKTNGPILALQYPQRRKRRTQSRKKTRRKMVVVSIGGAGGNKKGIIFM